MATSPRIVLRPTSATLPGSDTANFGKSIFDAVGRPLSDNAWPSHRSHYERCLVRLEELRTDSGESVVVLGSAGGTDTKCDSDASRQHHPLIHEKAQVIGSWEGLPFARAVSDPSLLSTDCPTVGLSRIGWYSDRPISHRGKERVRLGVVGVVIDGRGRVLLTRRARRMRSFPRAWVMPGGGVDHGETMADALIREIAEETGVCVARESLRPVGMWESAYPTSTKECVERGTGLLAHYLVVFFLARIAESEEGSSADEARLTLQENETDAAAWISPEDFRKVVQCPLGDKHLGMLRGAALSNGILEPRSLSLQEFAGIYPRGEDVCGIAQGHLYILEELFSACQGLRFDTPASKV